MDELITTADGGELAALPSGEARRSEAGGEHSSPAPALGASGGSRWHVLRRLVSGRRATGLLVANALVFGAFTIANPAFAGGASVLSLLRAMTTLALISLGELFVMVTGELDLSMGAVYGLGANVLAVAWVVLHVDLGIACLLAFVSCVVVGLFNGLVTTYVRLPSFIVTLGSMNIVQGIVLWITNENTMSVQYTTPPLNHSELSVFLDLSGAHLPLGVPAQAVWGLVVAILLYFLLHRTLFGFRLFAIGGNVRAARVARLPVRRYKIMAFVIVAVVACLAGILDLSFIGSTEPDAGSTLTFPVFAAVVIGGTSLAGGRGTVAGVLWGALLLTILDNGLALLGVGDYGQLIFIGGVTVGAVALDYWSRQAAFTSSIQRAATALYPGRRPRGG